MKAERDGPEALIRACGQCLGRSWLLGRLAGHLDVARSRLGELLALDDDQLIGAVAGRDRATVERERAGFAPDAARAAAGRARLGLVCRCDHAYPRGLLDLAAPPAVLHFSGPVAPFLDACGRDPVAIVGTREPTAYGMDVAVALGRQLAAAGVTVISGMARGIDAAAHRGALERADRGDGAGEPCTPATIAVLPGGAEVPYPRAHRRLHAQLMRTATVLSELPPGTPVRRWMFPARNRLVAAIALMTVVVEAGDRSGSLVTARVAAALGRAVAAVPGRVTTAQAAGPLELIAGGATLVRDGRDIVDRLFGVGARTLAADPRPALTEAQAALLRELESGRDTPAAIARAGPADAALVELAALELAGWVRRGLGGRYSVIP
jgi:DNA processing protein